MSLNGEKIDNDYSTKDEMHGERWKELTAMQEEHEMCHAVVCPVKSRMRKTMSFTRLSEGAINRAGETMWNVKKATENNAGGQRPHGGIATTFERIAEEWREEGG